MIIHRHAAWVSAKAGVQCVMMNLETDEYIGLTRVGARIWELIEVPMSVDALHAQLLREFEVPPELCRREVAGFLDELARRGAVIFEAGDGT